MRRMSRLVYCCRVNDEKDARRYLQALAAKMTDELEVLRTSVTPAGVSTFIYFYLHIFILYVFFSRVCGMFWCSVTYM